MKTALCIVVSFALFALAGCEKKTVVEGEGGTKLGIAKPSDVTVTRGEMEKVKVEISRKNLPGDVTVRFDQLPHGVSVVEPDNRIVGEGKDATYTLQAAADAELVEKSAATITATGPNGTSATETFNVTVKEKK